MGYIHSVISQLFILDGAQGGKKGKENKMGLDFMIGLTRCFDILAGLIILIYAIHASNSTREEKAVTGVSQLLHPGIHVPMKTTIMANP